MSEGTLLVKDSRTSREYKIPIIRNSVAAASFKQIKGPITDTTRIDKGSVGLKVYDPGLANTATIESKLTFIDGEKGTLLFRNYSIDQLWDCDFEDILHLMVWEKLPSTSQKDSLRKALVNAMLDIPAVVVSVIKAFPPSTPPVPMIMAGLAAYMSTKPSNIPAFTGGNIYHGNMKRVDPAVIRSLAAWAVVVGLTASHLRGTPFVPASHDRTFYENVFVMMGHVEKSTGLPDPLKIRSFRRFGALSIDHGLSNSTFAMLVTTSSLADPISGLIAALTAAYGPLHFGAPESAYKIITELDKPENVPWLIESVKRGERRLFGYGHRTYTTEDPRIRPIKVLLEELDAKSNPLLKVSQEIDRVASSDEYFKSRGLNANADLYGVFFYIAM